MKFKSPALVKTFIHLLVWGIILLILAMAGKDLTDTRSSIRLWFHLIESAIIFYLNYLFLVQRFLFTKKNYLLFFAINILIILFFRFDMHFIKGFMGDLAKSGNTLEIKQKGRFFMLRPIISLIIPALVAVGIRVIEMWRSLEIEKTEIENKHLQSELKNLKYQLQPHFFFNSLNSIYSLTGISPESAQKAIHTLSKLMRYLLYDTKREQVDISVEIDFLKKYIQLMEIRQSQEVKTNFDFPEIKEGVYTIAPLLLIPAIENAYKHGVAADGESEISIKMTLTNCELQFSCVNSYYPRKKPDTEGSGIGLDNLKKRLELLYPGKSQLITEVKDNKFYFLLSLKIMATQ